MGIRDHFSVLKELILERNCRIIAEIGIFKGQLMRALLRDEELCCGIEEYWAVDPWETVKYPWAKDVWAKKFVEDQSVWDDMYWNVCKYMPWFSQLRLIKLPSVEASRLFKQYVSCNKAAGYFDLVFIDGDHFYESVKADLEAWYPLVKKGGVIVGHDYDYDHTTEGVKQAVDEFFGLGNFDLDAENFIWKKEVV